MKHPLAIALLAGAFLASAQDRAGPAAIDPAIPVPPPGYRSAFTGLPSGVESSHPDWLGAQAAVARFPRGHSDIVQWEAAGQAPASTPIAPNATKPAATATHPQ